MQPRDRAADRPAAPAAWFTTSPQPPRVRILRPPENAMPEEWTGAINGRWEELPPGALQQLHVELDARAPAVQLAGDALAIDLARRALRRPSPYMHVELYLAAFRSATWRAMLQPVVDGEEVPLANGAHRAVKHNLRYLCLNNVRITADDAHFLARLLLTAFDVEELCLDQCAIDSAAAPLIAAAATAASTQWTCPVSVLHPVLDVEGAEILAGTSRVRLGADDQGGITDIVACLDELYADREGAGRPHDDTTAASPLRARVARDDNRCTRVVAAVPITSDMLLPLLPTQPRALQVVCRAGWRLAPPPRAAHDLLASLAVFVCTAKFGADALAPLATMVERSPNLRAWDVDCDLTLDEAPANAAGPMEADGDDGDDDYADENAAPEWLEERMKTWDETIAAAIDARQKAKRPLAAVSLYLTEEDGSSRVGDETQAAMQGALEAQLHGAVLSAATINVPQHLMPLGTPSFVGRALGTPAIGASIASFLGFTSGDVAVAACAAAVSAMKVNEGSFR